MSVASSLALPFGKLPTEATSASGRAPRASRGCSGRTAARAPRPCWRHSPSRILDPQRGTGRVRRACERHQPVSTHAALLGGCWIAKSTGRSPEAPTLCAAPRHSAERPGQRWSVPAPPAPGTTLPAHPERARGSPGLGCARPRPPTPSGRLEPQARRRQARRRVQARQGEPCWQEAWVRGLQVGRR